MADKRIIEYTEAASAGADYYLVTDSASDGVKKIKPTNIVPAFTGDVTSTAGGTVNTIAANAVTNAKAAQMAAGTIKSNLTGALASASDNTINAVMDAAFGSTQGAVAYRGASGWTSLAPGVSGQFMQTSGPSANPVWQSIPGGGNMLSTNNLSELTAVATARNNITSDHASPGSFWPDKGAADAKIFRLTDRLFMGDEYDGTWNVATSTGLTPEAKKLHGWAPREAAAWIDHRFGTMAVVGHAQASQGVTNGWPGIAESAIPGPIGVSGFAIGDVAGATAWGVYADAVKFSVGGFTAGIEVSITNLGANGTVPTPFNAKSGAVSSSGLWVQSGGGLDAVGYDNSYGTPGNASAGLVFVSSFANNSTKFLKGIVIADGALVDISGGSNVFGALDMPVNHQISWYRSDGSQAAAIWAIPAASGLGVLTFKQDAIELTTTTLAVGSGSNDVTIKNTGAHDLHLEGLFVKLGTDDTSASRATGYPCIPLIADTPTGSPTPVGNFGAITYDALHQKLCVWNGSAWKSVALT